MNLKQRYLSPIIQKDLQQDNKMVFLGGPRQVGKTTLATELVGTRYKTSQYYNWDKIQQRRQALKGEWPPEAELLILDEFHKYSKWKTWIKGEYDTYKQRYQFLLTGSARLNIYRRGGDSLQGRYHYYCLHPFSLNELLDARPPNIQPYQELGFKAPLAQDGLDNLLHYGGFPEPLLKQEERHLRRWHNERIERFFKEDIRDLTRIHDMGGLALFAELLPNRVASILSINAIATDLSFNYRTIANWFAIFENFYYCFRLAPYQSRKIAAAKKEKKLYLWDWSAIPDPGARLENLVASHLLKFCHYLHDAEGWQTELYYLRDITGREVDFLVCCNNKPWFAVEVKTTDTQLSPHLRYYKEKLKIPFCYQTLLRPNIDLLHQGIRILSLNKFLSALI